MDYEVIPDRHTPGVWRVEWTVDEAEGEFCVAIFSGPGSRSLAEDYAAWKKGPTGRRMAALTS